MVGVHGTNTYSYDEVPYPNNPFPQSHPDRLATIATLFGMKPQPIDQCRILELGCGGGGNLVPLAEQLPHSEFVGVELSRVQISQAQEWVKRLRFDNVELKHINILDVDAGLGKFDYIICHGVFSWVPTIVQNKILDICAENLAPQGVAYISYNTYPGWSMRGMIRDMMCYHSRRFDDPQVRIDQARGLLDFLAQHTSEKSAFGMFLKSELEVLRNQDDGYLYHEHLEEVNDPIYFYQFAERAELRGLQYLGESDMSVMYRGHLPAAVKTTLDSVAGNLVQMEQYMDFMRNRMFRQSLLCREGIAIDHVLQPSDLANLYLSSSLVPEAQSVDLLAPEPLKFKNATGTVTATDALMKSALVHLTEAWPDRISYSQLLHRSRTYVDRRAVVSAEQLQAENNAIGRDLLTFYVSNLIELYSRPASFTTRVDERPLASRFARRQAEGGKLVTNLLHGRHMLSDFERHLLRYLNGSHDHAALVELFTKLIDDGTLVLQRGLENESNGQVRSRLAQAIQEALVRLSRAGLLLDNTAVRPCSEFAPAITEEPAAHGADAAAKPTEESALWNGVWNS